MYDTISCTYSGELRDYPALTGVRGMCGRTCQQSIKIVGIEESLAPHKSP